LSKNRSIDDHFLPEYGRASEPGRFWGEFWLAGDHFLPKNRHAADGVGRT